MRLPVAGAPPIVMSTGAPERLLMVVRLPALSSATATSLDEPSPPIWTVMPDLGEHAQPLMMPLDHAARPSLNAFGLVRPPRPALVPIASFGFVIVFLLFVVEIILKMHDSHADMRSLLASSAVDYRIYAVVGIPQYPATVWACDANACHLCCPHERLVKVALAVCVSVGNAALVVPLARRPCLDARLAVF